MLDDGWRYLFVLEPLLSDLGMKLKIDSSVTNNENNAPAATGIKNAKTIIQPIA